MLAMRVCFYWVGWPNIFFWTWTFLIGLSNFLCFLYLGTCINVVADLQQVIMSLGLWAMWSESTVWCSVVWVFFIYEEQGYKTAPLGFHPQPSSCSAAGGCWLRPASRWCRWYGLDQGSYGSDQLPWNYCGPQTNPWSPRAEQRKQD